MNTNRTRITKELFRGISGGVMIFGILITAFMIAVTFGDLTSPIDGARYIVEKIHQIKIDAIWFGVAAFFIIIALPRPALLKRAPIAILAACFCWLIAWQFLFYCYYIYLHTQSIDLFKVLQNASPH